MTEEFYPQGKLCVCSVQKKEEGFEDYRYIVDLAATSLGFHVLRNPESGITQAEFELCLNTQYPVFVFIVGNVKSEVVNREFEIALKKCLPIFIFIKEQDGKISDESREIITQLSKGSYDYDCIKFSNCEHLYMQVSKRLKKYILDKEKKRPTLQKGVSLAYRANTELMKKCKRLIAIYQSTSILMLGPRKGCMYEIEFYKELTEWLMKNRNENIEFLHIFNWRETLNEKINNADRYSLKEARKNILDLQQYMSNNEKMNIRFSESCNSVSYVITDTNLVFIIPVEGERFSIELPAYMMKEQEINTILDEITRKTSIISLDKIKKFYE